MYSVAENRVMIEIKKSKFIACLFPVTTEKEVNKYVEKVKADYPGATHYCYAYIIGNKQKCSDDHEPHGTAGAPILNVLIKRKLNCVLCVVVRYFGGIKLGAGGLVRAYSSSVARAIANAQLMEVVRCKVYSLRFTYDLVDKLNYFLQDVYIAQKD